MAKIFAFCKQMEWGCRVVRLNLQFHDNSAVFSVDAIAATSTEDEKENGKAEGTRILATGGGDGAVRIWRYSYERASEAPRKEFEYGTMEDYPLAVEHLCTLKKHRGSVNCVRFSKDKRFLATAGDTGAVLLWEVDKILESTPTGDDHTYAGAPSVVRDPDGTDIYDIAWTGGNIALGTASGKVEVYEIKEKAPAKKETATPTGKDGQKRLKVISAQSAPYTGRLLASKKAHKDVVQGVASGEEVFASFGNERSLVIHTKKGKKIKKITDRPLFVDKDKHVLFFRRLAFSDKTGTLYVPSGTHDGKFAVFLFERPEWQPTSFLGGFPSSPGNVHITERYVLVSEGRNLYVFLLSDHRFLFRVLDCAFLPITDMCTIEEKETRTVVGVSSSDGFLSCVCLYKR